MTPAPTIHWVSYSDDVFAQAKRENKFVLLDLEAVWCHWCHVQDEITYADPDVRRELAAHYIAVKVDQDSRPDLSNRYEDFGWPATIVLNADGGDIVKRAGYIPPRPMLAMLQAIVRDPTPGPSVKPEAAIEPANGAGLTGELRDRLRQRLDSAYDSAQGGWGTIHKFVDWDAAEYSLRLARAGDVQAESRAKQTLTAGLNLIDPVWGGVYQYSVEGNWTHPHYEKLMQFQAANLRLYALAGEQLHDQRLTKAADDIRRHIRSFLTSPDGAFYVSQDADVVEGQQSDAYFVMDDAGRRKTGIPRVDQHIYSRENGWAIQGLLGYYARTQHLDDLQAAKTAAEWIIAHRAIATGGFRHGDADPAGPYLADTLEMARAFLSLYEATADRAWLDRAKAAADFLNARFSDSVGYVTAVGAGPLKPRPDVDENISAARFFNLLAYYTGRAADRAAALHAMQYISAPAIADARKLFVSGLLLADAELSHEPTHITIVGSKSEPAARELFLTALRSPISYRRLEWFDATEGPLPNADVEYPTLEKSAAFLCEGTTCSTPMTTTSALEKRLSK